LPSGHAVQIKLVAFENSSTKQPVQVRSLLSLPGFATRWPAEHRVCAKQNVCPVSAWYLSAGHVWHEPALASLENWPLAQTLHVLSVVACIPFTSIRVPAVHTAWSTQ
jgi:hypothetical protein